jgi:hypothetical protein
MKKRSMKEIDRMVSQLRESTYSSLMTSPRF